MSDVETQRTDAPEIVKIIIDTGTSVSSKDYCSYRVPNSIKDKLFENGFTENDIDVWEDMMSDEDISRRSNSSFLRAIEMFGNELNCDYSKLEVVSVKKELIDGDYVTIGYHCDVEGLEINYRAYEAEKKVSELEKTVERLRERLDAYTPKNKGIGYHPQCSSDNGGISMYL